MAAFFRGRLGGADGGWDELERGDVEEVATRGNEAADSGGDESGWAVEKGIVDADSDNVRSAGERLNLTPSLMSELLTTGRGRRLSRTSMRT